MMNAGIYWLMLELDHSAGKLLKPHFPNIEEGWVSDVYVSIPTKKFCCI